MQSVLAKPCRVGGVCQPAAVVGYVRCADRKERVTLCQLVSVENDLFRCIWRWASCAAGFSAMNRVLQFLLGSRVIPPTAVSKGNRYVGLLDVAQHFVVELFLQAGQRSHLSLRILVFRFEISNYVGIFLVTQPCVIVGEGFAVNLNFCVLPGRDGGMRIGHIVL